VRVVDSRATPPSALVMVFQASTTWTVTYETVSPTQGVDVHWTTLPVWRYDRI
jgi:hypothetical protein